MDVNGGAAELSWSVRTSGCTQDCCGAGPDGANIETIRLCVRNCETYEGGVCSGTDRCPASASWFCERFHGTTTFELDPGPTEMWIEIGCPAGTTPHARVPEPIVREVVAGEVVQLNALLVEATDPGRPVCYSE